MGRHLPAVLEDALPTSTLLARGVTDVAFYDDALLCRADEVCCLSPARY